MLKMANLVSVSEKLKVDLFLNWAVATRFWALRHELNYKGLFKLRIAHRNGDGGVASRTEPSFNGYHEHRGKKLVNETDELCRS